MCGSGCVTYWWSGVSLKLCLMCCERRDKLMQEGSPQFYVLSWKKLQMNTGLNSKSVGHIKQARVSVHLAAWLWGWPRVLGNRVRQNHLL